MVEKSEGASLPIPKIDALIHKWTIDFHILLIISQSQTSLFIDVTIPSSAKVYYFYKIARHRKARCVLSNNISKDDPAKVGVGCKKKVGVG